MAELSSSLEQLAITHLARIDARLTPSRRNILSILESSEQPLTVIDMTRRSRDLAQSSLYRNLSVLEEADLVHRISGDHEFAFFELAEHVLGHHHHLRCSQCGEVRDIELSKKDEDMLHRLSDAVAKDNKFTHVHHHLEFVGLCNNCSR